MKEVDDHLFNIFKTQLEFQTRIERAKVALSLKTDFNLIDAFRIFDRNGLGVATSYDFKAGLAELGLQVSDQELGLFMKRFDKDGDLKLRYSEFCDAFLPSDTFHGSLLAKKAPLTMYPQSLMPCGQVFYPETVSMFLHTWTTHIQCEVEAEKLRILTQTKRGFSAHSAFYLAD
jgi:hypothetical protein